MRAPLFLLFMAFLVSWQTVEPSNKQMRRFLTKEYDFRLFAAEAAKLGVANASSGFQKSAQAMAAEQTLIAGEAKRLSDAKKFTLPTGMSSKNRRKLRKLSTKTGPDFDRAFLSEMAATLKRDIRELYAARESQDTPIAAFAEKYLPITESQLEQIRELQRKL